jgi:hypothetical protein
LVLLYSVVEPEEASGCGFLGRLPRILGYWRSSEIGARGATGAWMLEVSFPRGKRLHLLLPDRD